MSEKRTLVITGVTKGLGYALTNGFIEAGHTVWGCGRSKEKIAELKEKWPSPHEFAAVDITDNSAVENWAKELLEKYEPPDLLLNNAGVINKNAKLWNVPAEEFSLVVDVNIKGTANVIRHFVPAMVKKKSGMILNFSSGWGRSAAADVGPYCATKWAIEGLTRSLAEELPSGMAAIPINPGVIDTEMLQSCFGKESNSYGSPEQWAQNAVPFILQLRPKDNGKPFSIFF